MGQKEIAKMLIKNGLEKVNAPYKAVQFTGNIEADNLINNLEKYPHAFVLYCVMDRQIPAEKAWLIPYKISQEINGFEFNKLLKLDKKKLTTIFNKNKLHRFNKKMAGYFYSAVQRIHTEYKDDASKIWANKPSSATVVRKFLEFDGVGPKIATMAVSTLVRKGKIPLKDKLSIDIPTDTQIITVFTRTGLIRKGAKKEEIIYRARELYPKFPSIFDYPAWRIGKDYCHKKKPDCQNCLLDKYCPKII